MTIATNAPSCTWLGPWRRARRIPTSTRVPLRLLGARTLDGSQLVILRYDARQAA